MLLEGMRSHNELPAFGVEQGAVQANGGAGPNGWIDIKACKKIPVQYPVGYINTPSRAPFR